MLGDKLGSATGKITAQRVLPNPGGGPKMETSFQAAGTLLGVSTKEVGTYWAVIRPDGTVYGEGQGVLMGAGGEAGTWVGAGVGTVKKDGAASYRGAIYYQSAAQAWVRLNSVAAVFEFEADPQGNTKSELWEWK
jgi:hypothetical protein